MFVVALLTCTDHTNIFPGLEIFANQVLDGRAIGDRLSSLGASRDYEEIITVLQNVKSFPARLYQSSDEPTGVAC